MPDEVQGLLALAEFTVNPDSQVSKLLRHGARGLETLSRLAEITLETLEIDEIGKLFLPWYHPTEFGNGEWWESEAKPIRISEAVRKDSPFISNIARFVMLERDLLLGLGPCYVVKDTSLDISIVMDGCKRLCAAYMHNQPMEILFLKSDYAHMLYPSDFLNHIVKLVKHAQLI